MWSHLKGLKIYFSGLSSGKARESLLYFEAQLCLCFLLIPNNHIMQHMKVKYVLNALLRILCNERLLIPNVKNAFPGTYVEIVDQNANGHGPFFFFFFEKPKGYLE